MKQTMDREGKDERKKEIPNSQMEDEEVIQTVKSKENFKKGLKQEDNSMLEVNWRLVARSPAEEVDTQMNEVARIRANMADSKQVVKEMLKEEINKIAKEIDLEEERIDEENKEMEEEEL